jgi:hypothetical protein
MNSLSRNRSLCEFKIYRRRETLVNGIGDTFGDEETESVLEQYRERVVRWKTALDEAPPNQIVELPSDGFPEGLSGVALRLRYPANLTHSGWLFRHMSDASHGDVSRVVGVAGASRDFKKLTQSSSIGAVGRLYVIATGPRAEFILHAAVDSEARYDPDMFDSDGYLR